MEEFLREEPMAALSSVCRALGEAGGDGPALISTPHLKLLASRRKRHCLSVGGMGAVGTRALLGALFVSHPDKSGDQRVTWLPLAQCPLGTQRPSASTKAKAMLVPSGLGSQGSGMFV